MELEVFLSTDAFVMTNKKLIKKLWLWKAVFLQELISQRKRFKQPEFYFTQNDMEEDLWINQKTQSRYSKELKDKWLINFEKKGIPARNYYTINDDVIIELLSEGKTCSDKMSALDTSKCPDYSNNNTDNNNSNKKFSETLPKNENSRAGELDACARVESYDDIQEVIEDDSYRVKNNKLLKCIVKMCELWYQVDKKEKPIRELVEWIKEKAEIYNIKNSDWTIAQWTMLQIFDQWCEYWKSRGKVTNHKNSVMRFMINYNKPYKK